MRDANQAFFDFADFAHQVEFFVDVAAEHRSDFLVFPELFTSQLLSLQGRERPGPAQRKLARTKKKSAKTARKVTRRRRS